MSKAKQGESMDTVTAEEKNFLSLSIGSFFKSSSKFNTALRGDVRMTRGFDSHLEWRRSLLMGKIN